MPTPHTNDGNGPLSHARPPESEGRGATVSPVGKSWLSYAFGRFAGGYRRIIGAPAKPSQKLNWPAGSFILLQVVIGLPLLPYALLHWHPESELRFACFFAVALAASIFKVRLPGIEATMSANFLFILVGILDLSYPETLLMGCFGGLVQSIWQAKPRPTLVQLSFSFANLSIDRKSVV